ncbi:MAG: PIG-L family deacetylase [bacterium]|nr:PIG-L family deacetylase [bacterium]
MKNNNILIIASHPDDEILGCGGTITRLVAEGAQAYTLILGTGITSRLEIVSKDQPGKLNALKEQAVAANKIIGVKDVIFETFPDNKFDSIAMLDIVKTIENIKNKIKPNIIFTHYQNDLNIDHQITNQAVLTATRPMIGESVKEIYAFEVLSSTEWHYPLTFFPNTFFDISNTLDKKIEAMSKYKLELKDYPHPRSLKNIELNAEYWGNRVGIKYCEVFQCLRNVR